MTLFLTSSPSGCPFEPGPDIPVLDTRNHFVANLRAVWPDHAVLGLALLPEQTQEEIFRYYFLRQPQRVIGVHIGRTRSTAGRHIRLALQRLREEMGVSRYE